MPQAESPDILLLKPMRPDIQDALAARFRLHRLDAAQDPDALLAEVGPRVRGLAVGAMAPVDAALLRRLPRLEIVASFGVGYDTIDVGEAARRGVVVTNTPDVLSDEVADLALGLLLAAVRQIPQADRYLRAGRWREASFPLTTSLRERRVGILGLGRIGRAIAGRLAGFGVTIAYHGRSRQDDAPYAYHETLLGLARAVDVLIVAAPGGAGTHGLVDAAVLAALGPEGIVINIARGSVIDEPALIAALTEGTILGAGLDVYADEPHVPEALAALDHVVLLPHVGSGSHHTRTAMARLLTENLAAWFEGKGPLTPVPETPVPTTPAPERSRPGSGPVTRRALRALAVLTLLAAPPAAAQEAPAEAPPDAATPSAVAPPAPDTPMAAPPGLGPTLPDTLAGAAGTWDIAIQGGARRCMLTFSTDSGPSGRIVRFPAGCRRALPLLGGVAGWLYTSNEIRLVDRNVRPLLVFAREPDARSLAAVAENGQRYSLVPLQIAAMQPAIPPMPDSLPDAGAPPEADGARTIPGSQPVLPADGLHGPAAAPAAPEQSGAPIPTAGVYALDRFAEKDVCRLELSPSAGSPNEFAAVRLLSACRDSGMLTFDPAGWRFANGHMTLKSRRGHAVSLVATGDGRWRRDPEIGIALVLRKVEP